MLRPLRSALVVRIAAVAGVIIAAVTAVTLAASWRSFEGPARPPTANALLLGGLPPAQAAKGVYVVELDGVGDLSPGSRLGPLLEGVIDDAEVLVETAAPPVTLLGGVPEEVAVPEGGLREGTTLVFAEPAIAEAVVQRLRDKAEPSLSLRDIADDPAPVRWHGPTPAPNARGTTTIRLSFEEVSLITEARGDVVADVWEALKHEGPPGSPGKSWRTMFRRAEVVPYDADPFRIAAQPGDLPGLLLRALIDQQQLTFLSP
jgi:hypothetical protein